MVRLQWDKQGSKFYESGVDRGVLYLTDGTVVPWSGLTSVVETFSDETTNPLYLNGKKYYDEPNYSSYQGTLSAVTYPTEFEDLEGVQEYQPGLLVDNQPVKTFSLSYRTSVGNDVLGLNYGYQTHLLYNLTATPTVRSYKTVSNNADLDEFSWDITGLPVPYATHRATAHLIIFSYEITPLNLLLLEARLYGSETSEPSLPLPSEIISSLTSSALILIDNGDGTWTANGPSSIFTTLTTDEFVLNWPHVTTVDADTYILSDT